MPKINIRKLSSIDVFCVISLLSISFLNSSHNIRYIFIVITVINLFFLATKEKLLIFKNMSLPMRTIFFIVIWGGIGLLWTGYFSSGYLRYLLWIYQTLLTFLIAVYLTNIRKILYSYFLILLLLNLFFMIFMKQTSYVFTQGAYAFRGLYYEKNILALNTVCGLPLFIEGLTKERKKSAALWILLSVYILFEANSTSAMIFMIILSVLEFVPKRFSISLAKLMPIAFITFSIYLIFYDAIIQSSFNFFFKSIVGKGLDFSGRIILWLFSLEVSLKRPLLGYGFNGLWSDTDRVITMMTEYGYQHVGGHAHNGYIEILVSLGLVGFTSMLYILTYIYTNLRNKDILNKIENIEVVYFLFLISYFW